MREGLVWGNASMTLEFEWSGESAPRIAGAVAGAVRLRMPRGLPLVDVLTAAQGHALASDRLVHTEIGHDARYAGHRESLTAQGRTLQIDLVHPPTGIAITAVFELFDGAAVVRREVIVTNTGAMDVLLCSVTSASTYLGGEGDPGVRDWCLYRATSDWLGEGRWAHEALDDGHFPPLAQQLTGHNPRGELRTVSTGTWSTGKHLPVAAASSARLGAAWAWQIEHNGAWRWELGDDTADGYLALSGPTDGDHQWSELLAPGASFRTVPAVLALGADTTRALGELTRYRRAARRAHPDNAAMPVVFNDYMNTLNGDPTTEKLLPLIDAAAHVGADVFCIDAGWYDDGGDWWDSVGEWRPSSIRFPNGLGEVIHRIHEAGMVPGLWLEPEVIGVNSPMADRLPASAFLQRHGQRLVEHHRYHLDLRDPAARAHLDDVVDRLVAEFGIGFFKLDYNIDPGAGTDLAAASVGAGLLAHNRAHLDWLDGVLDRHPALILENCASGAMRADFAMLSRLQMQSTSDQQDFLRYPPIAASAPAAMLPEQAASWAYPQPEMNHEEIAFCLATGMLGRFYVSGHLGRMEAAKLALVAEAVTAAKSLRTEIARSTPFWPLGIPAWSDDWTALGLADDESALISIWNRGGAATVDLELPDYRGEELVVTSVFPHSLPEWGAHWDAGSGSLRIVNATGGVGARVLRVQVASKAVPATAVPVR